jgi:hypothetical protein
VHFFPSFYQKKIKIAGLKSVNSENLTSKLIFT